MQVLALVRKAYNIDEHRIYLVGHSMGAIGTWYPRREISRIVGLDSACSQDQACRPTRPR